ncbi:MAG: hypothetical protein DWB56_12310 [Candidatus Jettenia sp.]|uniref:hypothetical protein n=1 Tax=Candidatus Jettenia sp. AMX1 TaxID=2293637 RepID=UPI0017EC7DF6|nr:hypothetical protein [Candidatus Jettenia sp. AMX1]MBC6929719.1 hypothetical protein [Candidatus Jettenia sp.]MDL1939628.1 hypothetical protein [Candidatus Jettenia sp. AMX1]NUO09989.1 hypothetical protein [Candidatus Brocadia sp.]GJQ47540.1 MAG: hypothetical protein JETCAE04_32940 [Candidatus Jettenia caeni]
MKKSNYVFNRTRCDNGTMLWFRTLPAPVKTALDNKKGRAEMSDDKKRITKVRVILSVILLTIIVAAAVTWYRYYRANRWITVQDSSEDWVTVEGRLAEKNSAPCPQMILKQGRAKFLPDTTGKSEKLLGYKLAVAAEKKDEGVTP